MAHPQRPDERVLGRAGPGDGASAVGEGDGGEIVRKADAVLGPVEHPGDPHSTFTRVPHLRPDRRGTAERLRPLGPVQDEIEHVRLLPRPGPGPVRDAATEAAHGRRAPVRGLRPAAQLSPNSASSRAFVESA
ncbi:hypothetical protein SAV14893_001900 [Streptomyces avermitilis]|uniref:Uncharacterized protein n=1 Tax=Streptomyces avermitilis TaxID=33903 RepID=A0A4D4LRL3_STRAX|nr:hypothetical protein SAVMC3_13900 [Streptomyces avermitilis]GDY60797.1 hypothetical protein SAV14893_001900 [Streptomyces avermitilis]GDY88039.1 hypothetical protein SAVCW2_72380 [Streptomyces avermitilis]